jgi:hypothetical protein
VPILICYSSINAQTTIVSDGQSVSCVLPNSICIVTETKEDSDAHYIGDTLAFYSPSYAFDETWFESGLAVTVTGGDDVKINGFKLEVVSEPSLPDYPDCQPDAETPGNSFGLASNTYVKILALGPIDKARYPDAAQYVGQVYKAYSDITPIGGCWYAGIIEKDDKIFIFPCMQVQKVDGN